MTLKCKDEKCIYACKDRTWDGPNLRLDFGLMSPNNEFIESEERTVSIPKENP